jgi:DinB superfamily
MPISQSLLPEFDQEMAGTRKELERVPEGQFDWKPHPKSMLLGRLASHLAELPSWGQYAMELTELDIAPPGQPPAKAQNLATRAEVLALFDKSSVGARKAIAAAVDADWMVAWTLKKGGVVLFTLPRIAVVRSMVMNHMIHHRAQLGVYLRLLDVPLPGLYGPTADEGPR